MKIVLAAIIMTMASLPLVAQSEDLPTTLAVVNGVTIRARDIEKTTGEQVRNLQKQVTEARTRELDLMINSKLLALEAKKRGLTTTKLLEQEVVAKVKAPTQAEARMFYDQNKTRIQGDFASDELALWYHRAPLKLLGSLAEGQRRAMLGGGVVPVSQLSSQAKEELIRFTYGEHFTGRGIFGRLVLQTEEFDPQAILGNLKEEATEALPNGIPAGAEIRGVAEKLPMILERYLGDFTYSTSYTPESFGDSLARNEADAGDYKSEIYLGSGLKFKFKVKYGSGMESEDELPELERQPRTKFASWKDLPAALRFEIEKGYKAAKEELAKQRERRKSSGPPPPLHG